MLINNKVMLFPKKPFNGGAVGGKCKDHRARFERVKNVWSTLCDLTSFDLDPFC